MTVCDDPLPAPRFSRERSEFDACSELHHPVGGMLKKSGTELALRAMRANRRLRHRIMGARPVGMSRMQPR
jgi:hypothetical protein